MADDASYDFASPAEPRKATTAADVKREAARKQEAERRATAAKPQAAAQPEAGGAAREHEGGVPVALGPESIKREYWCYACGWDLKGSRAGQPCKQCGTPVRLVKAPEELQFAAIGWVRKLAWGAALLPVAAGVMLADAVAYLSAMSYSVHAAVSLGAAVVMTVGIWLWTSAEPRMRGHESKWPRRRVLRIVAGVALGLVVVENLLCLKNPGATTWVGWYAAGVVPVVARTFLLGLFLQEMARKIPNDSLAERTLNVTWGVSIVQLVLMAVAGLVFAGADSIQICLMVPMGLTLGFAGWGWVLLVRYALDLRACVKAAERNAEAGALSLPAALG